MHNQQNINYKNILLEQKTFCFTKFASCTGDFMQLSCTGKFAKIEFVQLSLYR